MKYSDVDENALSEKERFGLAYCRLNCWEWDDFIGPKPEGFDGMPKLDMRRIKWPWRKVETKSGYIGAAMKWIRTVLGEEACSRAWWRFELKGTDEEWREWYDSGGRMPWLECHPYQKQSRSFWARVKDAFQAVRDTIWR